MKTIVFNLNTLVGSLDENLDDETSALLIRLMSAGQNVVILSDLSWKKMNKLVVSSFNDEDDLNKLYILPASGSSIYQKWGKYGWIPAFQSKLNKKDIETITTAINDSIKDIDYTRPEKQWGKEIENREGLVSFAALGQKAPSEVDSTDCHNLKFAPLLDSIKEKLQENYEVTKAGMYNINILAKGIDKKNGINELMKRLHISKDDVVYVGKFFGKNEDDFFAVEIGFEHIRVSGFENTKVEIRKLLDVVSLEKTG